MLRDQLTVDAEKRKALVAPVRWVDGMASRVVRGSGPGGRLRGLVGAWGLLCALETNALAGVPPVPVFVADPGNNRVVNFVLGGSFVAPGGFATGVAGDTMSICIRPGGQMLAAQFSLSSVVDITAGGDFTSATPFATGIGEPLSFICSATQVLVADYVGGRIVDVAAGGDFTAATPFATNLSAPIGMQAIGGRLYVVEQSDGLTDVTDGGDMTGAPIFAMPTGAIDLRDVEGFGNKILLSGADSGGTGRVWDVTAGGTTATVFATLPAFAYGLANVGGTLWVITDGGRIYDITAGGTFLVGSAFATGFDVSFGHAGFTKEPFVLTCGDGIVDSSEDCDDSGESATCNANCTAADCAS
jgi:hypothetical protein